MSLQRQEEALVVAERGRTRAVVDLLLERQAMTNQGGANSTLNTRLRARQAFNMLSLEASSASAGASLDHMIEIVNKQKACVLYFSIAAGYLYSWFLMPNKGWSKHLTYVLAAVSPLLANLILVTSS